MNACPRSTMLEIRARPGLLNSNTGTLDCGMVQMMDERTDLKIAGASSPSNVRLI
jgi:hypothetical protein